MSTIFFLELIEPSSREVLIFWAPREREEQGACEERRREQTCPPAKDSKQREITNLAKLETVSELEVTSSRRKLLNRLKYKKYKHKNYTKICKIEKVILLSLISLLVIIDQDQVQKTCQWGREGVS